MVTQNVTLDGVNNFSAFGTTSAWSNLNINYISVGIDPGEDPNQANSLNATLAGAAWRIRHLNLYNDIAFDYDATLTDSNAGVFRRIDRFEFSGPGDVSVSLLDTRIRYMTVSEAASMNLTLGSQRMNSLESDAVSNTITMGSGTLTFARLGLFSQASTNVITGGTGNINALELEELSNNTITNIGFFGSIRSRGDVNNFTFVNGGDSLSLGSGISTVNLTGGFYGSITSYSGTNTITVGAAAEVRSIGFSNGVDIITVRGSVEQIQVGGNDDRVEVLGEGRIDSLMLGDGNNRFVLDGQWTWAVTAFSGNDTASVNSGQIDQLYLGSGNNMITVGEGVFIGSLRVNNGDDKLTVDGGDIVQALLSDGKNTILLRSGQIESLITYNGADKITVRDGSIYTINAMGGNNVIQLGTGFTNYVGTYEGRDTITLGTGSVFTIGTGDGNDTINATAGRFSFLQAGAGNDVVTLGAAGARFVGLDDGDDLLSIGPTAADRGTEVQGGAGNDTVDLSRFTSNLTLTLENGNWQEPVIGQGFLAMIQIENAIGGSASDSLAGSEDDNRLAGGFGLDTLLGGDGNDTLVGGRGNDSLTGGLGADTFTFLQADGRDAISDFVDGEDRIELREANGIGDLVITQAGGDVRIDFGALRITVQNALLADIADAANFLF